LFAGHFAGGAEGVVGSGGGWDEAGFRDYEGAAEEEEGERHWLIVEGGSSPCAVQLLSAIDQSP
jgi:hypothetical protein